MAKKHCEIRIGTSGWHYLHWAGRFYPDGLAKDKWLAHYAQYFDTVEINNTFYQLPKAKTFENWYAKTLRRLLGQAQGRRREPTLLRR